MKSVTKIEDFFCNAHFWFFCGFLATSTLSVRKVLFYYPIDGKFNEYTGIYLYLADIFFFLAIISWLIILYNKKNKLSITKYSQRLILTFLAKCRELFCGLSSGFFARDWRKSRAKYSICPKGHSNSNDLEEQSANTNCSTWNNLNIFHGGWAWNNFKKAIKNVPRGTFHLIEIIYKQVIHRYLLMFPLILAIISFVSILWANNPSVALFRALKLLEFIIMYYYIVYLLFPSNKKPFPDKNASPQYKGFTCPKCHSNSIDLEEQSANTNCSTWNIFMGYHGRREWNKLRYLLQIIMISGLIHAIIGIMQFVLQHSIGFYWLKESIISPNISGVAKIIFDGQAYIRVYGLFPHPNILGGFLVMSILITIVYFKMFHVEHFGKCCETKCFTCPKCHSNSIDLEEQSANTNCSTWNILDCAETKNVPPTRNAISTVLSWKNSQQMQIVPRGTILLDTMAGGRGTFYGFLLAIQGIALFLTFSKSAFLGLFVGFFYLWLANFFDFKKMFHVEQSLNQNASFSLANGENVPLASPQLQQGECGTFSKSFMACEQKVLSFRNMIHKMFHVEHIGKKFLLLACILMVSIYLFSKTDLNVLFLKSLYERDFYLNVSRGTFLAHPVLGIGAGQYVFGLLGGDDIQPWQFQPVHNVFLLVLNEYGIFMFLAFIYFIYNVMELKRCKNVPPAQNAISTVLSCKSSQQMQIVPRGTILWNFMAGGCGTIQKLICSAFEKKESPETFLFETNDYTRQNVPRGTIRRDLCGWFVLFAYLKAILIAFTFIMLFDHYFWDIQQGQIMLWLVLAIIAGYERGRNATLTKHGKVS